MMLVERFATVAGFVSVAAVAIALGPTGSIAADVLAKSGVDEGRAFVAANCAACHAIERDGASPLDAAPPFRELHNFYPIEYLEEALAEGIVTGHPDMPQFVLEPDLIGAVIAYLKTLE